MRVVSFPDLDIGLQSCQRITTSLTEEVREDTWIARLVTYSVEEEQVPSPNIHVNSGPFPRLGMCDSGAM